MRDLSRLSLIVPLILATACSAPPPEAPTDLNDLTLYLFREFDVEDEAVIAAGLANLGTFLTTYGETADLSMESSTDGRAWEPVVIGGADLGSLSMPEGASAEDQLRVALAVQSAYTPMQHAQLTGLTDQTPIESSSSAVYDREHLTDLACFLDGSCDLLETRNDVLRDNILLTIPYELFKDYRWVELPDDGGTAMVARSWVTEQATGESGTNTIDQTWTIEAWIPHDGGALRYVGFWTSGEIAGVDDFVVLNLMESGLQEGFQNTEDYIANGG